MGSDSKLFFLHWVNCIFVFVKKGILQNFKGLAEMTSSKNAAVNKNFVTVFENSYVAQLAYQVSLL